MALFRNGYSDLKKSKHGLEGEKFIGWWDRGGRVE